MDEILLIGGGGHCRSVVDVIEAENRFKIAGIIDQPQLMGTKVLNYEVIGCDEDLKSLTARYKYALITVGQIRTPDLRIKLFERVKEAGFILPVIVSPRAYVSLHAAVGEGSIIMHDALVNACAQVGDNCIINSKALIEHDSTIGHHCHISTNVTINGGVKVEGKSFIGSGAVTKEYITIQGNSFVKAGTVVK
jgi:sugar O-acyltransferase (sialic acid O-acetyltransferase NeuD family)